MTYLVCFELALIITTHLQLNVLFDQSHLLCIGTRNNVCPPNTGNRAINLNPCLNTTNDLRLILVGCWVFIGVTSRYGRWRLKLPASLFFYSTRCSGVYERKHVTVFCAGWPPPPPPPPQRASNAESVSIWWRHHMNTKRWCNKIFMFFFKNVVHMSIPVWWALLCVGSTSVVHMWWWVSNKRANCCVKHVNKHRLWLAFDNFILATLSIDKPVLLRYSAIRLLLTYPD